MAKFKFKIGEVLVGGDQELVIVVDTHFDAHTFEKDYYIETIKPGTYRHRTIGKRVYVDKSICEAWFYSASPTEQVLYGR